MLYDKAYLSFQVKGVSKLYSFKERKSVDLLGEITKLILKKNNVHSLVKYSWLKDVGENHFLVFE